MAPKHFITLQQDDTPLATFNLSAEMRNLLQKNPKLTGKEALEKLKSKYPKQDINSKTAQVSFSNARKKLGLSQKKRRKVAKRKPASNSPAKTAVTLAPANELDLNRLEAARVLLISCDGDEQQAIESIRMLIGLQIS